MGKAPADQFYYGDWLRDTAPLSLAAKGAWITCLAAMWFAQDRGVLTMRLESFARLFGCNKDQAGNVLDELVELGVGDRVTLGDGRIELTCRRMVRDQAERDAAAGRQRKSRSQNSEARSQKEEAEPKRLTTDHRPLATDKDVTAMSRECHSPSSSSTSYSTSDLIESYAGACVRAFPNEDPRLIEVAILETMINRQQSPAELKPIRSPAKYFAAEIKKWSTEGKGLGSQFIDGLLEKRRGQVGARSQKSEARSQ